MSQAISPHHPAVVLRSHYQHLRALLAVAMIAVVGLTAAVVILATNADEGSEGGSADPLSLLSAEERRYAAAIASLSPAQLAALATAGSIRYDGGPDEGSVGPHAEPSPPGTRYDGGPDEGSPDIPPAQPPGTRYDNGPEEGTRGPGH
jgi:hypothetical protein